MYRLAGLEVVDLRQAMGSTAAQLLVRQYEVPNNLRDLAESDHGDRAVAL